VHHAVQRVQSIVAKWMRILHSSCYVFTLSLCNVCIPSLWYTANGWNLVFGVLRIYRRTAQASTDEGGSRANSGAGRGPIESGTAGPERLGTNHDGSGDDLSSDGGGSDGGMDMQAMYERNLASLGEDSEVDGGDHSASGEKDLRDAPRCSCDVVILSQPVSVTQWEGRTNYRAPTQTS
jgi:hypothetical protein